MGATTAFIYAGLYPNACDLMISFDSLKPLLPPPEVIVKRMSEVMLGNYHINKQMENGIPTPTHSYDEMVNRWIVASQSSLTKEVVPLLLKRSTVMTDDQPPKYRFVHDQRLKAFDYALIPQNVSLTLAKRIKIPFLFIRGSDGLAMEEPHLFQEALETMKKNNKHFEFHVINGKHHFHLTQPEVISERVSNFLIRNKKAK